MCVVTLAISAMLSNLISEFSAPTLALKSSKQMSMFSSKVFPLPWQPI